MMDCSISHFKDRRIKSRHAAPCLGVTLRAVGLMSVFKRPTDARCIDINRYGMALESCARFKSGDRVILDFRGKYICQSNIEAIITSCSRSGGVYRYGLTFAYCLSNKSYSREIDNALSRIESLYNNQYQGKTSRAS
ncbi:MAG: PilZ domain-containing protein [Pseudomonadales bacterium]|nr:PilZ domain-containing protein [Pseudomonadales bacterium]